MKVKRLQLGFFSVNCYILHLDSSCIIIDPGAEAAEIEKYIDGSKSKPLLVINTHGHYDHSGAVPEIINRYGIKFYIHRLEEDTVTSPEINLSSVFGGKAFSINRYTLIDKKIEAYLKELGLGIIHTPGHTPGSISIKTGNFLFCGDLLFKGAVGRTDLAGGDLGVIKKSLRKIRKMDKNLVIYPGHGQDTVLEDELASNYYLSDDFLG
ncbi:MAG: MBL fold metallo-hydrolase [Actinomycetota bacterium]